MSNPSMIASATIPALLNAARVRRWCSIALAVQIAFFIFVALGSHGLIVPLHGTGSTDFVSFYAAGHLANGPCPVRVYDRVAHLAAERAAIGSEIPYVFFFYPPVFLLLCGLLAHLPYLAAFVVFEVGSGIALLLVLAAILRRTDRLWLLPVLSFSPLFWAIGMGQNSCLSAVLFGAGCLLLERRRNFAAGLVLSLLMFKPHLGLLLPLALIAGGRWRAVLGATLGVSVLVMLSVLCFGIAPWFAFAAVLFQASNEFSRQQVVPFSMLASSYGSARLVGLGQESSTLIEVGVDFLVALCVWKSWRDRNPERCELNLALLVAGTLLVMPVVLFYDTTILLVAAAWIARAATRGVKVRTGWIVVTWLLGLFGYSASRALHLPFPILSVICCFLASLQRATWLRFSLPFLKSFPATSDSAEAILVPPGVRNPVIPGVLPMLGLYRSLLALKNDRRGVTAVEYGIIAGVLGLTLVGVFTTFGGSMSTMFLNVASKM